MDNTTTARSTEIVPAIYRAAECELGEVPTTRRSAMINRVIREALTVLAGLEGAGAGQLAYPRVLVRAGMARSGSLA